MLSRSLLFVLLLSALWAACDTAVVQDERTTPIFSDAEPEPVVTDTEALRIELDGFMNRWHEAAATADEAAFFGMMAENGIYIGTDPTERWLRDTLRTWAAGAFERDTAWAFVASSRNFYFPEDRAGIDIVWFDELLDTWMGVCRGSGVLERTGEEWKLRHYHLSFTILNENTDALFEMREAEAERRRNNPDDR